MSYYNLNYTVEACIVNATLIFGNNFLYTIPMCRKSDWRLAFINNKSGFTLIELIVVIGIIGVLATLGIGSYSNIQKSARDSKRYSDLRELKVALLQYFAENGKYPTTAGRWFTVCTTGADPTARTTSGSGGWIPDLAPEYIDILPTDPSGCVGGAYDGYIYQSNGVDYKVSADWTAEIGANCHLGDIFADPNSTSSSAFTFCSVYTSAASNW